MPDPLISVVIPAHNGETYLDQAIESALNQTWPRTEVVVVDDGSTDRSADIASGYDDVVLVRQENRGVARARNRGVEESTGELLAFLDQDDMFVPEKLERQLESLRAMPEAGVSSCRLRIFIEPGFPRPAWLPPNLVDAEEHTLQVDTMLVWRKTFEQVGGFDPAYEWANDQDWLARVREADVPIAMVDEPLALYRVHDHNESSNRQPMIKEALAAFRASVKRKQARAADE